MLCNFVLYLFLLKKKSVVQCVSLCLLFKFVIVRLSLFSRVLLNVSWPFFCVVIFYLWMTNTVHRTVITVLSSWLKVSYQWGKLKVALLSQSEMPLWGKFRLTPVLWNMYQVSYQDFLFWIEEVVCCLEWLWLYYMSDILFHWMEANYLIQSRKWQIRNCKSAILKPVKQLWIDTKCLRDRLITEWMSYLILFIISYRSYLNPLKACGPKILA